MKRIKVLVFLLVVLVLIMGIVGVVGASEGVAHYRSPGGAFLWSLLIVGGGQIYNGQWGKGLLMMGLDVAAYVMIFSGVDEVVLTGAVMAIVLPIWSMVDAPLTAAAMNRKAGFVLDFEPENKTVKLGYYFNLK